MLKITQDWIQPENKSCGRKFKIIQDWVQPENKSCGRKFKIIQDWVQPEKKSCDRKYMWRLVMETQQGLILETTTKMQ